MSLTNLVNYKYKSEHFVHSIDKVAIANICNFPHEANLIKHKIYAYILYRLQLTNHCVFLMLIGFHYCICYSSALY